MHAISHFVLLKKFVLGSQFRSLSVFQVPSGSKSNQLLLLRSEASPSSRSLSLNSSAVDLDFFQSPFTRLISQTHPGDIPLLLPNLWLWTSTYSTASYTSRRAFVFAQRTSTKTLEVKFSIHRALRHHQLLSRSQQIYGELATRPTCEYRRKGSEPG